MKRAQVLHFALLVMVGVVSLFALTTNRVRAGRKAPDAYQKTGAYTANAPAVGCVQPPSGLVSWWPLDGNVSDFQVSNDGIPFFNPPFVPGKVAQAMQLSGGAYVKVNASSSLNVGTGTGVTIDLWINPSNVSSPQPLIEWNNGSNFGVHFWIAVPFGAGGPGSLFANIADTTGSPHSISSAQNIVTANSFQHVALTYDKTTGVAVMYVNGSAVFGPANIGVFTPQTSYDLYFGRRPSGTGDYAGLMDEIELFNRALSAVEVQAIFNADSAGKCKTRCVTNTNDSGAGSLRQVIIEGNAYPGPDTICFNIPGAGAKTVSPTSSLPNVLGAVVIDGWTQGGSGYTGPPLIELNGTNAGATSNGLTLTVGPSTVNGLVINRFGGNGIELVASGATLASIQGCYIGLSADGSTDLGNNLDGVFINGGSTNSIGGTTAAARNVISGNNQYGIEARNTSVNNVVHGNYIGTDATGALARGNSLSGVLFDGTGNTIGGTTAGARNVVSGNVVGITLSGPGHTVAGNFIGTDAAGTARLGSSEIGIRVSGFGNMIGGTTAASRNIISANNSGILLEGSSAQSTIIQNNFIGTDVTGTANLGCTSGVDLSSASGNTIGGGVGLGNLIAFNVAGIRIFANSATSGNGNAILANSIFSNIALGIDLFPDGLTPNDPLDADTGANGLQNFPELIAAVNNGFITTVYGALNSTRNSIFTLEFFSNPSCDSSGNGEGQTFLGTTVVTTGADGYINYAVTLPPVAVGQRITATATNNSTRDTSEFSACRLVTAGSPTAVDEPELGATAYDDGVLLEWRTGMEVNNLGFNLYRDDEGKQRLINLQLIAGSAFLIGANTTLGSGEAYQLWDSEPASKITRYWLESRDLNGGIKWHGPFASLPSLGKQRPLKNQQARTLASLLSSKGDSLACEPRAKLPQVGSSVVPPLPQSTAFKIAIQDTAWYKVTQAELIDAGFDPALDPRRLQLFVDGKQQAIRVNGEQDGRLDADDSIEFYGVGVDSPYSKTRTYWLVAGKDSGQRIQSVQSSAKPNPTGSFACATERRDRTIYFAALLNGEKENFFGSVLATQPLDQTLTSRHLDSGSSTNATLEIAMQGVTQYPHQFIVQFNGANAGYMFYQGQANSTATFSVPSALVREGVNTVTLTTTGAPSDVSLVDYIRLTYQHSYTADDDRLRFTAEGGQPLTVSSFSSDAIRVFDVTHPETVREVKGEIDKNEAGHNVSLYVPGSGERTLLAMTDERAQRPAMLTLDHASSWRSDNNGADLLIITVSQFLKQAAALKVLRESQGISVAIVDVVDIYDEFSYGQKTPGAVRQFLGVASKNWKRSIRYALFFGDASYDPKDHFGLGDSDLVPTRLIDTLFMETASDDWLADFNNDGIADTPIGRLPARTEREAELLINKLITYEKSSASGEALLVADRNDGYDFERAIDELRPLVPGDLRVTSVKRGQMGDAAAKAVLIEALNRGQRLVSYSGHGSANVWRANLLTDADASQLQNGDRLSVFVMMNCLNGYFHDPRSESLSEALAKAEKGGAVVVWASSAMTFPDAQIEMTKEFYRQVFGDRSIRLGDAVARAKAVVFDTDVRRTWILIGDPTLRLK